MTHIQVWEESEEQQVKITVSHFITSRGAGGWVPGQGGHHDLPHTPASAPRALRCCCFGIPQLPCPHYQRRMMGR